MNDISLVVLFIALIALLIVAAFFNASETGMLALNRYRLGHLAKAKHPGAMRTQILMLRMDRLIGLLMMGNHFANNLATAIATVIGLRLLGESGVAIAATALTLFGLIFAEVAPKTLAALHPERIAFPSSYVLGPLLKVLYPAVWLVNTIANGVLRVVGISASDHGQKQHLSSEELRTVVNEAGALIPRRHQRMLLSILDLEKVTVEDIMVPRNEMVGIDLEDDWNDIADQLTTSEHTRLLIFSGGIENVLGILHLREVLRLISSDNLSRDTLLKIMHEPYFVPEGTPLNTQLLNFQRQKRRVGLVVDEYGDIQGLVTLEDILEEIVGQFTSDPANNVRDVHVQADGSYLVEGSATVRELNRNMRWELPTDGPKTLNGLIMEYLEAIPEPGISLRLAGYPIEIMQTVGNAVKIARISPGLREVSSSEEE